MAKALYISATGRNVGKTFVSLGLISSLSQYFERIGYIKPVGQRYIETEYGKISADAVLVKDITSAIGNLSDMSPVIIESGLTEDFIMGRISGPFLSKIIDSYNRIANQTDLVIIEGTGHSGVGSVIDASNADVAKALGADVILVADGGIGSTIDRVTLNRTLFEAQGVRIIGVIVNKILLNKLDRIQQTLKYGFRRKGIKMLGALPYQTLLSSPTLSYLVEELHAEVIHEGASLNHALDHVFVADSDVTRFIKTISAASTNILAIIDSTRIELMLAAAASVLVNSNQNISFLISGSINISPEVLDIIKATSISVVGVKRPTYDLTKWLHDLSVKLVETDKSRLDGVIKLVNEYVNSEEIRNEILQIKGKTNDARQLWLKMLWFFGILINPLRRVIYYFKEILRRNIILKRDKR